MTTMTLLHEDLGKQPLYAFFTWVGLTITLGFVAQSFLSPAVVWGGTDCFVSNGIYACTGYPPIGIALIAVVSGLVVAYTHAMLTTTQGESE